MSGMVYLIYFLNIGGGELVVILLFILIFFGSKSIPDLARGLGKGIREFKNASDSIKREITQSARDVDDEIHTARFNIKKEAENILPRLDQPEDPENKET
jgi:sec-independent protein translocase protein TatA